MKTIIALENSNLAISTIRKDLYQSLSNKSKVKVLYLLSSDHFKENDIINIKNLSLIKINWTSIPFIIFECFKHENLISFTTRPLLIGFLCKLFIPKLNFYPTITGTGPLLESKHIIYKILRLIYPELLKSSSYTFFHNQYDAFFWQKKANIKNFMIVGGSGIDPPKELPNYEPYDFPNKVPRIAAFSRLLVDKGILEFLEATTWLLSDFPSLKGQITLAGMFYGGNLKNNVITAEHLQKWIQIGGIHLGQPENKSDFYLSTNILCLPSYREGLSNVMLEGSAHGCILLATNVPGCIDIIEGDCGVSCEPKSAFSLYKSLKKAISLSPDEQMKLRENSFRKLKEKFSKSKVIDNYNKILF
tara:strand:+ start:2039 stop:3118 length:1080 start_codon:yes stop_codon:yes gene_type:complete